jgi:hypothetical protein
MSRTAHASVTAVVVVGPRHDAGSLDLTFLPQTLAALAAQTVAPDRIVLAHTGSGAQLRDVLTAADLEADLVDVGAATGFGHAVARAIDRAGVAGAWLWLLHDDSAPEPTALAALAQVVETGRSIAVAGCKQVAWHHPDRLVSVGVQYTWDIQRFTGIEDGEVDQGQHDDREDIDAVGTAGMLIDREVFASLGGPDTALGPYGDGRDLSRRARLAGHRVVVVPRAVVRHARASYLGLRRDSRREPEPDPHTSFRARRTAVLHSRLVECPAVLVPFVALAAVLAGPARVVGRLISKELVLVGDELLAPFVALAGWRSIWRARGRARATQTGSARRLRPLRASWGDVARVRRDRRLAATAQRRSRRAPSELEMRERASLGTRRRLVLAAVMLVAAAVAGLTLAPIAFHGPLLGGALAPSDASFGELWAAVASTWLASGDGQPAPADPFLAVLGVLSAVTGGSFGTPVWLTISIVLVAAIPLSALTAWFAAGAATRSLSLRAWAALVWALGPPLVLGIASGRLGPVVAHVTLPLVGLGLARAFGLDRRDVVVSGLVGARRVEPHAPSTPGEAGESRQRRLAALAAVAQDAPTAQIARVLAGDPAPDDGATDATASRADPDGEEPVDPIPSNTAEPYQPEEEEFATIVSRASGVGSVGAAAAAGLCLTAAAAGAPVLLPAALLCLLLVAVLLGRRSSLVAGRSRLLLVGLPPLVLLGPLLAHAAGTTDGWRLLLSGPGVATPTPEASPGLVLLAWPQDLPDVGLAHVSPWLALAASVTVLAAALIALVRGGSLARGVRLAWLVAAVGAVVGVVAPRVDVAVAHTADADVVARGWAGPGTSLVLLGLVMATATASGGLRAALHGRSFGWRQLGVAVVSLILVGGVALAAVGWTTMLRGDVLALVTRNGDPVPAIGDELAASDDRARVLALWPTSGGIVDAEVWRSAGPQLTESSSVAELAQLTEPLDEATQQLGTLVAELATGTVTEAAERLAEHAVGVVLVPPTDSAIMGGNGDDVARSRLISLLDGVPGLERVTENSSGVVWRVSTERAVPARAVLISSDGVSTPVPAGVVDVDTELVAAETEATLVLAERAQVGWHAWLDGAPLRSVTYDWHQAFEVPAGAAGHLVVRYDPPLPIPWRGLIVVTFVVVALIALPTRRRRLDTWEEEG